MFVCSKEKKLMSTPRLAVLRCVNKKPIKLYTYGDKHICSERRRIAEKYLLEIL